MSKYEKIFLIASEDEESYLIENRMFVLRTFNQFAVGQIVNVKLKEAGKSTKNYSLEINLVDGRHFIIFSSGIKEKSLRKQFAIRRFIEEYFENKNPRP
jgi:ribosome maturation factor RimP